MGQGKTEEFYGQVIIFLRPKDNTAVLFVDVVFSWGVIKGS